MVYKLYLYIRPKQIWNETLIALKHLLSVIDVSCPLIIMGDFNIEKSSTVYGKLCNLMALFNCEQHIQQSTTEYNTTLDLIFTNIQRIGPVSSGVLQTYFSYHNPIWISFPQQILM